MVKRLYIDNTDLISGTVIIYSQNDLEEALDYYNNSNADSFSLLLDVSTEEQLVCEKILINKLGDIKKDFNLFMSEPIYKNLIFSFDYVIKNFNINKVKPLDILLEKTSNTNLRLKLKELFTNILLAG